MDNRTEFVMNAIDSSGFQSTATAAGYINPEVWNTQVLRHIEDTIVVQRLGKVYNDLLGAPGDTLNVTINSAPLEASAVDESADVTISAYAVTQVIFTPTEYAFAYALSDKEARRGFYSVANDMTAKIGYALALKREKAAIALLQGGAGNAVNANSVVTSAIASTDTLDFDDIANAKKEIQMDLLIPRYLIISPGQHTQLLKNQAFRDASQFGGRESILGGEIAKVAGLQVIVSTLITPATNVSTGLVLGVDMSGEPAFGIAMKANPTVRTERFELGRYTNFVGVEEWSMKVLRANGICTLKSYDA